MSTGEHKSENERIDSIVCKGCVGETMIQHPQLDTSIQLLSKCGESNVGDFHSALIDFCSDCFGSNQIYQDIFDLHTVILFGHYSHPLTDMLSFLFCHFFYLRQNTAIPIWFSVILINSNESTHLKL